MSKNNACCGNCRFGMEIYRENIVRCRIVPPTVIYSSVRNETATMFPELNKDSWCGKYVPNDEEMDRQVEQAKKALRPKIRQFALRVT